MQIYEFNCNYASKNVTISDSIAKSLGMFHHLMFFQCTAPFFYRLTVLDIYCYHDDSPYISLLSFVRKITYKYFHEKEPQKKELSMIGAFLDQNTVEIWKDNSFLSTNIVSFDPKYSLFGLKV